MRQALNILAIATVLGAGAPGVAAPLPDAAQLVAAVDSLRLPAVDNARSSMRITTSGQAGARSYSYTVFSRDAGERSLVLAMDGDQKGQKYLSTPQGYWFYAPRTRRAIRMTPLQVLRGQASIGDVARLRFAEDYTVTFAPQAEAQVDGETCWVIALKAKSDRATYASALLWVRKAGGSPVKADLTSLSGRKLKTMLFARAISVGGRSVIRTVTYVDGVNPLKQTKVEVLSITPANSSMAMFRPEALSLD
jgi:outer membrane lipoprotein-sorting protein